MLKRRKSDIHDKRREHNHHDQISHRKGRRTREHQTNKPHPHRPSSGTTTSTTTRSPTSKLLFPSEKTRKKVWFGNHLIHQQVCGLTSEVWSEERDERRRRWRYASTFATKLYRIAIDKYRSSDTCFLCSPISLIKYATLESCSGLSRLEIFETYKIRRQACGCSFPSDSLQQAHQEGLSAL